MEALENPRGPVDENYQEKFDDFVRELNPAPHSSWSVEPFTH
jgi:hypothetical protein